MDTGLQNKVALVTGAGLGIGRAIALGLARQGASVAINYRKSREQAHEVVHEIEAMGGTALAIQADVSKKDQVAAMVQKATETYGSIDILVNNAGIRTSFLVEEMTEEQWDLVLDTNLKGTFFCSQAVIPPMKKQHGGKIINITSGRGLGGMHGSAHYSASKAGVIGFTKSLALELAGDGINVNAVIPGPIDTEQLRTGKTAEQIEQVMEAHKLTNPLLIKVKRPEEVVGIMVFLATDTSRSITGQVISME